MAEKHKKPINAKLLSQALKELGRKGDPVLAMVRKGRSYLVYFSSPTEPVLWTPKSRRTAKGTPRPTA